MAKKADGNPASDPAKRPGLEAGKTKTADQRPGLKGTKGSKLKAPKWLKLPKSMGRWRWIALGGVALALLLLIFGVLIYKYRSRSTAVAAVAEIVPYPVMKVNGRLVSYADYLFELDTNKHFYENEVKSSQQQPVDFNSPEGQAKLKELEQQVMERLKRRAVSAQLIAEYKIKVDTGEVDEQIGLFREQAGSEEKLQEILDQFYGWSLGDLKDQTKFRLAEQKLAAEISKDDSINAQAKARAEEVLKEVKAGGDFAELAKKHSQDTTAASGGELPEFKEGDNYDEDFKKASFALQPGQVSELVKTKFGYHIIKVIEKKGDSVKVAHILIKSISFEEYLQQQVENAKVSIYLKV